MSGPKIDSISIERMRAMQLAAERSRNESMLHDALVELDKSMCALKADHLKLRNHRSDIISEIEKAEQSLRELMVQTATRGYPAGIEEARLFNDRVSKELEILIADIEKTAKPIRERINSAVVSQQETARIKDLANRLETTDETTYGYLSDDVISRLLEQASAASYGSKGLIEVELKQRALEDARLTMSRLRIAIASDTTDTARKTTFANYAKRLSKSLIELDGDAKDPAVVRKLLNEIKPVLNEIETHDKVMKDLYAECVIQSNQLQYFGNQVVDLPPLWRFGDESELELELSELKTLTHKLHEDLYIEYALDRVMSRHGYTIARKVTLSDGQHDGHRMFMREQDDIGIHTYLAPNGILAMEVSAVDSEIKSSGDNQKIRKSIASSNYDRMRLVEEQRGFCELHPSIISELSEYGVCIANLKDKEPSEDNSVVFEMVESKHHDNDYAAQGRRRKRSHTALREREAK